ncbi:MAG TPA: hypothetical protein VF434_01820, partial [Promineifilum sp.]
PETAYAPAEADLRVGFYAPEGYRLAVTAGDSGEGLGDSFALGRLAIDPAGSGTSLPNPGTYRFEDRFRLLGYAYDRRLLGPSDDLSLTLYWEAMQDESGTIDVQVRLLDEQGRVLFAEQRPLSPMAANKVTLEGHTIPADPDRPAGYYTVQVSLEDPEAERRLQLVADDGRWLDDKLLLSAVRQTD